MSEFLLSKTHIDALVTAAVQWSERTGFAYFHDGRWRPVTAADGTRLGEVLRAANVEVVTWGDPQVLLDMTEGRGLAPYSFEPVPGRADPYVVKRLVACYLYQSMSDPDAWHGNEASSFCEDLDLWATALLAKQAGWPHRVGEDDRDIFERWAEGRAG